MDDPSEESAPRLLEVDLSAWGAPGARTLASRPWRSADALLDRVGSWSGSALALALFLDRPDARDGLVLSVGECVRRGLPTAARTTLTARSPLTGRIAEGQVGSDLGRRLARVADALYVRGRTDLPGAVLHVGEGSRVELLSLPIVGADCMQTQRLLEDALGPCASVRVGPAGESAVPFANLAAGGTPPSFVGRGGLGAVLGGLGLKAIAVTAKPGEGTEDGELVEALLASPRLHARGVGGTMELAQAFGVRGDLRARGYSEPVPTSAGLDIGRAAERAGRERRGCQGCPTPCGWVFERADGARQGAHFSAVYALGTNLGLAGFDDALVLLDACDRLGLDAKETGAGLALFARARETGALDGPVPWGDRDAFVAIVHDLVLGRGDAAGLREGSAAFARNHGLGDYARDVAGEAARPESDLAAVLGQCAGARGAEPMRTFPFLVGAGGSERLAELLDPLAVPPGTEDPLSPVGKGRVVWWHENLVAAVDTSGFCAFSAAGLLADGVCTLDALAAWIAPSALADMPGADTVSPGMRLLSAGATLVALQHELNRRFSTRATARPAWAQPMLDHPGMLPEYRRLRGVDAAGEITPEVRAGLGTATLARLAATSCEASTAGENTAPVVAVADAGDKRPGRVTLRSFGPLARELGPELVCELDLPAPLVAVLAQAARERPCAMASLLRGGEPVPAAYRSGRRLGPEDAVGSGDRLDLVLAVSGG